MQGDKEVVLAAVTQNSLALGYASTIFLGDKEIILASISAASYETEISLTQFYHFTRNNVEFFVSSLKDKKSHPRSNECGMTDDCGLHIRRNAKRRK